MWTKESARKALEELIKSIKSVKRTRRFSAEHTRWTSNTLRYLEQIFGRNSRYYMTFANYQWARTGQFIVSGYDPNEEIEMMHQEAYLKQMDSAEGLLMSALDELNGSSDITELYHGKNTAPESSAIVKVLNIVDNKLRKTIHALPNKERVVQDALENLFIGTDIDYSRENESIEYSSKTYIPDFSLKKIDLVVEIKYCDKAKREKDIIAEINDDILAYKTKYGNVLFVVYDIGIIRDIDKFRRHFETHEGVIVRIVKH